MVTMLDISLHMDIIVQWDFSTHTLDAMVRPVMSFVEHGYLGMPSGPGPW